VAACAFFFLGGGACGLVVKTTCGMLQLRTLFSDNCTSIGAPMTKIIQKALLSGFAAAIVATFAVAASAQSMCAWPTSSGQCLPPPPGGSIISYPAPLGVPFFSPWQTRVYVPGQFPSADTVHLAQ
jgi:hypothetical protein